jgi:O-antigen ligase
MYYWQGSAELMREHPLTGVGDGMWREYFFQTPSGMAFKESPVYQPQHFHPHNNIFHVGAVHGLPALAAYIIFLCYFLARGFLDVRSASGRRSFVVFSALYISFISITLQGVTDMTVFSISGGNMLWALVAVWGAYFYKRRRREKIREKH